MGSEGERMLVGRGWAGRRAGTCCISGCTEMIRSGSNSVKARAKWFATTALYPCGEIEAQC